MQVNLPGHEALQSHLQGESLGQWDYISSFVDQGKLLIVATLQEYLLWSDQPVPKTWTVGTCVFTRKWKNIFRQDVCQLTH